MLVDALMLIDGPTIYYDDGFRNVLEDHMTFLRTHQSTRPIPVDPSHAYRYEYDLYGYLTQYGVPVQLHWVVMRMNKMTTPMQFDMSVSSLLIPDPTIVDQIRQSHMATRKVS